MLNKLKCWMGWHNWEYKTKMTSSYYVKEFWGCRCCFKEKLISFYPATKLEIKLFEFSKSLEKNLFTDNNNSNPKGLL